MPRRKTSYSTQEITTGCIGLIILIPVCYLTNWTLSFIDWMRYEIGAPDWLISGSLIFFLIIILAILAKFTLNYFAEKEKRVKAIQISNIDFMEGIEFEQYLKKLLSSRGYFVQMTRASGDLGVDLVAFRSDEKIAIQAKRYNKKVSRRAISDAVAGMNHYGCNKSMVITNNFFTPDAIKLAASTGCTLIDRDKLTKWIIEFQSKADTPIKEVSSDEQRKNTEN